MGLVADFGAAAAARAARNPVDVYLAGLSAGGRRAMSQRLGAVARILGYRDARSVEWQRLRSDHVAAIRESLRDGGLAPVTVNSYLTALRGVARAAWDLGLIAGDDYIRISGVKGLRRRLSAPAP